MTLEISVLYTSDTFCQSHIISGYIARIFDPCVTHHWLKLTKTHFFLPLNGEIRWFKVWVSVVSFWPVLLLLWSLFRKVEWATIPQIIFLCRNLDVFLFGWGYWLGPLNNFLWTDPISQNFSIRLRNYSSKAALLIWMKLLTEKKFTFVSAPVLDDNWFGQSIWYDNFCQTNIIDDTIW